MQRRLKLGVLYSRVRVEEKWIFGAMEKRGIDYDRLDDRAIHFDLNHPEPWKEYDAVLERKLVRGRTWSGAPAFQLVSKLVVSVSWLKVV